MWAKQVIFREVNTDEERPFMGIQLGDQGVLCAECGGFLEMEDVDIIAVYPDWIDFTEEIAGEDFFELRNAYNKDGEQ